jgi:monovalent cation:H+ antiporter, CPA1 family
MTSPGTLGALEIFVVLVTVASVVAVISRRLVVLPYSVALVVLGVAVALVRPPIHIAIDSELILAVLLPALVFEGAYRIDLRLLLPSLPAVLLLAIPGVLITAALVAVALMLVIGLDWRLAFLVGTMVAATDPAAILAVMSRSGAPRRLTTLVEAESLFNDGTGVAIFGIALTAVTVDASLGDMALRLALVTLGSVVIGAVIGLAASVLLRGIDDRVVEVAISLVAAYGSYLVAARLNLSGLIATVVCGLVFTAFARSFGLSPAAREAIDIVWEFVAFLATALVFLLIGLAIGFSQLLAAAMGTAAVVGALLVSRAFIVYGLLGGAARLLQWMGQVRSVPRGWLHVIAWSGLRGAVSVALALSLPADLPQRELLQGIVFGTTLLTLVVQGTTARPLIQHLELRAQHPDQGDVA